MGVRSLWYLYERLWKNWIFSYSNLEPKADESTKKVKSRKNIDDVVRWEGYLEFPGK